MPYAYEAALYVFQIVLTANQKLNAQKVPIDPDSDFLLRGIHGTSTGSYTVNMRLPRGNNLANAQLQNTNFVGTAQQPAPIGPSPVYIANGIGPSLDLIDTSGASNTLEIVFSGVRRYTTRG
jgi:hypothetical protein